MEVFNKKTELSFCELLHITVLQIQFKKVDGSIRDMLCTLSPLYIPPRDESDETKTRKTSPEDKVQVVYDIEAKALRSFNKASLISFNIASFDYIKKEEDNVFDD